MKNQWSMNHHHVFAFNFLLFTTGHLLGSQARANDQLAVFEADHELTQPVGRVGQLILGRLIDGALEQTGAAGERMSDRPAALAEPDHMTVDDLLGLATRQFGQHAT